MMKKAVQTKSRKNTIKIILDPIMSFEKYNNKLLISQTQENIQRIIQGKPEEIKSMIIGIKGGKEIGNSRRKKDF